MRSFNALRALPFAIVPWCASEAALAQEMQEYRVQPGDSCPSIAQRLYGDVGRIDLIHQHNPGLGRLPHRLVAGQVLRLPRSAQGAGAPRSDARVTFVRNRVDAYTPEQHRARRDEALARGHRLGTLDASSAELTFIDETQLQLGENTLVVVLGRAARRLDAGEPVETRLERGTLRASLAALAGVSPEPSTQASTQTPTRTPSTAPASSPTRLAVQTAGGARAQLGAGSSIVDVDARATTRLSVHQGSSRLSAAGRTVDVREGFGSRADRGRAPRPPQPLPAAPTWTAPFAPLALVDGDERAELRGTYARGSSGPAPVVWHVQLSRDDRFNDLVVDARVPAAVTNLDAQVGEGRYFARVSAVDADGFEGPPSAVASVRVARVAHDPGGPGRRASVRVSDGTLCALDGGSLAPITGPLELAPLRPHVLRCAADEQGRGAVERRWAVPEAGIATIRGRSVEPVYDGDRGARRVTVAVFDALGHPVDAALRVEAPAGATADPLRRTARPGVWETTVRWRGAFGGGRIRVFVEGETDERATLELDASAPPPAPPPVVTPPAPHVGLELAFAGDAMITFDPRLRTGLGVSLEARSRIPSGPGLLLGVRAGYLRFGCSGPAVSDVTVFCAPESASTSMVRTAVGIDTFDLGPEIGAYLARHNAPVTGYIAFAPQWIFHSAVVTRSDNSEVTVAGSTFSALATVGAQLRIGSGGLFSHIGYRGALAQSGALGALPIGGMLFSLGYRALF